MACRLREELEGRGHEQQASWWRLSIVGRRLLLHRLLHRLGLSLARGQGRQESEGAVSSQRATRTETGEGRFWVQDKTKTKNDPG